MGYYERFIGVGIPEKDAIRLDELFTKEDENARRGNMFFRSASDNDLVSRYDIKGQPIKQEEDEYKRKRGI